MTIRYRLAAEMRLLSPLHIGGARQLPDPDKPGAAAPSAKDGNGQYVIRGASVAGALRSHLRRLGRGGEAVWGSPRRASSISVSDVALPGLTADRRDGVGINRVTGAAAHGYLYALETVPTDTVFTLHVRAEEAPELAHLVEQELAAVAAVLTGGAFAVGHGTSRGLGRMTADRVVAYRADLDTLDGLGSAVVGELPAWPLPPVALHDPAPRLQIEIDWRPATGILVAAQPAADDDNLTTTLKDGQVPRPVLPGSSVKGALRACASRIARTAVGDDRPDWRGESLRQQLATDGPLVLALFGSTESRGALTVRDTCCHRDATAQPSTHVAIDRWTGAAATNRLFQVQAASGDAWDPIALDLDLARLGDDIRSRAALCLLGLVLAELAAGTVPLGSRGTRGLGSIEVSAIRLVPTTTTVLPTVELRADRPVDLVGQLLEMLRGIDPPGGWWTHNTALAHPTETTVDNDEDITEDEPTHA